MSTLKPVIFEGNINVGEGSIKRGFQVREKLVYITNDSSDYDIQVNFDATIGESGTFTIKAGESINDVPLQCTTISIQSINGIAPVRCMGV